jgi:sirohydrochlorin ferrochelatase
MNAVLLIDHGSTKREANEMLSCVANLVAHMVQGSAIVRYAHMELAEPTIADGFAACVSAGASHVIVFPYMLSPGKHSTSDIPRMVREVAAQHHNVSFEVTPCFGVEAELARVVLRRAGITLPPGETEPRCWNSTGSEHSCGDACLARTTAR